MTVPLVTAIVSTYASERFIRGCMEDLIAQTIFDKLEILVIDSGSPENESIIVKEYLDLYPENIRLLRTDREPLYVAWNRAIGMARGKYLTNANADDRHRKDAFENLANTLEGSPAIALVYADQYISYSENETFDECEDRQAKVMCMPDFTHKDLMLRCITGSQPMWRRELHRELGLFDIKYKIAADYDMWLRIAMHYPFMKLDDVCGVFYDSPGTISGSSNRLAVNQETTAIQCYYVKLKPWKGVGNIRRELAREVFGRGYQHIERDNDVVSAAPLIIRAINLDPFNMSYIKTYIINCVFFRVIRFRRKTKKIVS